MWKWEYTTLKLVYTGSGSYDEQNKGCFHYSLTLTNWYKIMIHLFRVKMQEISVYINPQIKANNNKWMKSHSLEHTQIHASMLKQIHASVHPQAHLYIHLHTYRYKPPAWNNIIYFSINFFSTDWLYIETIFCLPLRSAII